MSGVPGEKGERYCRNNHGAEDYPEFFFRLEDWHVQVRNLAIFSYIALALVSLLSCFLLAGDVKNFGMCHWAGERVQFSLMIFPLRWHPIKKSQEETSIIFVPE